VERELSGKNELGISAHEKLIHEFDEFPEFLANIELVSDEDSAPVVVVVSSYVPAKSNWADKYFKIMHRFSSGSKPEKRTVYKFLQDKGLRC
jgi:hypothetical protein